MISIDRISFEFAMDDEGFAQGLYADWDSFCRACVENIVEECLSAYDKDRVLHEIEMLDLDLGGIPQEDFYTEFPRRLRGELLKALPHLQPRQADRTAEKTTDSRFANLLYYLEHGVLKTEWADTGFDLSEEVDGLMKKDKRYLEKIAELCMANEYVLRRLLLQMNRETSLVRLYSTAMDRMFSVKDGKRRFMELFLEMQPDVPLRFVHGTEEDGRLHSMAELLGTRSVRRIMEKETAEHAEVDLPPYWHYLYEWLIKYYPYNGIAIFGGKSNFIGHLHYRLLTFIRKRNNTYYLSKIELTAAFLLEVFGAAYYKEVLNAIYAMQPRNADGSPAYDGYYNLQLYRVLMQLSLLYVPTGVEEHADETVSNEKTAFLLTDFRMEDLTAVLKDIGRSDADKRMIIAALVRQKPEELVAWLRNEAVSDKAPAVVMARLIDEKLLFRLLASVSLAAMETVDAVTRLLKNRTKYIGRLHDVPDKQVNFILRKAVLVWIGNNRQNLPKRDMLKELLLLVYSEATGGSKDETDRTELAMLLSYTGKDVWRNMDVPGSTLSQTDRTALSVLLKDTGRSDADKRMIVAALVQQEPEFFVAWLKTDATDDAALMTVLVRLIDERTLKRLLASTSLVAMETVDGMIRYLTGLVKEGRLSDGLTYEGFTLAARKAVLLWIQGDGYALSAIESNKSLLRLIHKETIEATGKDSDLTVEEWTEGLHLLENKTKDLGTFVGHEDDTIKESIRRLGMLLNAGNVSEAVKRRLVVSFLERHKERTADVIGELYEQGLLESAISRVNVSAAEVVIRQMVIRSIGTGEAEKLLLLIERLFAGENMVSVYLQDKSLTLKTQVLAWLAKEMKTQAGMARPFPELYSLFLTSLFGKENISAIIRQVLYGMAGEITTDEMQDDDILAVMELLPYTGSSRVRRALSVFEQWSQQVTTYSNAIQTLLESHWKTSGGFTEWLEDTEVETESKRELLQALAQKKPHELTVILRKLPQDGKMVSLMATYIPAEVLTDGMEKADAKQALLLSRAIGVLQKERGRFAFLSNMTLSFTTALSEALLLFMQDKDTLDGRNLTEQETVGKFLAHLYYVYTRRTDYNENKEWKQLQDEVTDALGLDGTDMTSVPVSEDVISERLLSEYKRLNDSELYHHITATLDKQPGLFVKLSEQNADTDFIRCISGIADRTMFRRMVAVVSSISGFENRTVFIRLMEWLSIRSADRMAVSDMMSALLFWISTTDWKRQSIRQMTVFFLSRLYGIEVAAGLPLEMLADDTLPEEIRKRLLHGYMRSRPAELLKQMQRLAAQGKLLFEKWAEWATLSEWLWLIANLSLTLEELLRQVIEYLLSQGKPMSNEMALRYGLMRFIATNDAARFAYYVDKKEVVHSFVLSLPAIQVITENKKEEIMSKMMEDLGITPEEEKILERSQENDKEAALVGNAGLCLLSPWFPRLFAMLGYLNEERRNFKDTASRIRAVFLLQYLASPEERDYREPELAFNRLLVTLPAQVPLPKRIELTDEEKRTADDMLEGVKGNWVKMNGTSASGFRQSFIMRDGRLEQQDERWLLTVENRMFDILLDTIPWAFRQIRYPWLKKYIKVAWHERQEF